MSGWCGSSHQRVDVTGVPERASMDSTATWNWLQKFQRLFTGLNMTPLATPGEALGQSMQDIWPNMSWTSKPQQQEIISDCLTKKRMNAKRANAET